MDMMYQLKSSPFQKMITGAHKKEKTITNKHT